MELSTSSLMQCMEELQVPEELRLQCKRFAELQQYDRLYLALRGARQQMLEEIHTAQTRLDCLDCLIYSVKKKTEGRP